mmetsp:Transcript_30119/g.66717  ORF Transcript_30119/g.66717 Transcript_30119/m.66717 type:complete len:214 (+) Transcript_30119:2214-2855(+)
MPGIATSITASQIVQLTLHNISVTESAMADIIRRDVIGMLAIVLNLIHYILAARLVMYLSLEMVGVKAENTIQKNVNGTAEIALNSIESILTARFRSQDSLGTANVMEDHIIANHVGGTAVTVMNLTSTPTAQSSGLRELGMGNATEDRTIQKNVGGTAVTALSSIVSIQAAALLHHLLLETATAIHLEVITVRPAYGMGATALSRRRSQLRR